MTHCKPIHHIEYHGITNFGDRIFRFAWKRMRQEFKMLGVVLPDWRLLKKINDPDEIWIYREPKRIRYVFNDGEWIQLNLDTGYMWDKISKPGRNNTLESMLAAEGHDPAFSLHTFYPDDNNKGFRTANDFFLRILECKRIQYNGGKMEKKKRLSWLRRRIQYRAVNSIPGRAYYENNERAFWHSQTAEFTFSGDRCWE